jgi:hypothetical protein
MTTAELSDKLIDVETRLSLIARHIGTLGGPEADMAHRMVGIAKEVLSRIGERDIRAILVANSDN